MNENGEEKSFNILVVDDDKDLRELLVTLIGGTKKINAKVVSASSGEEALERLESENYDLILVDQRMGGISGTELLSTVAEEHPETVRILITGYSDVTTAKDAINKAKVHHYLEKPCDNEEIISTIYRELERMIERKSADVFKVDTKDEAVGLLEDFKETFSSISKMHPGIVSLSGEKKEGRYSILIEFDDPSEFNKFSFELRENEELLNVYKARIEDLQVFENRYLVTVSLKP